MVAPASPVADAAPRALVLVQPGPQGLALGLGKGDAVVAVNGLPFDGTLEALGARTGGAGRPVALTIRREGAADRVVLADSMALGRWRPAVPLETAPAAERLHPEGLVNWEVLRSPDGRYDMQPLSPPLLALVAPPLWLAQARLWTPLAVWVALNLAALPAGLWAVAGTMILSALYFRRAGPALFRADRLARGMTPFAVLAAPSERALHAAMARIDPALSYVHAGPSPTAAAETDIA
jgi:hypothetical protein